MIPCRRRPIFALDRVGSTFSVTLFFARNSEDEFFGDSLGTDCAINTARFGMVLRRGFP